MRARGDHSTIFEAARLGDVRVVQDRLGAGADVSAVDAHGFTALHLAAIGADTTPVAQNLAVLDLLVRAGSPLEQRSGDGRTVLFLAAEFAPSTDAVRLLLDAGAQADVVTDAGLHVLDNAGTPAVAELLSRVTGRPVSQPTAPEPAPVRMRAAQWRTAGTRIAAVFEMLTDAGVVALQAFDDVDLVGGQDLGDHLGDADLGGDCRSGVDLRVHRQQRDRAAGARAQRFPRP